MFFLGGDSGTESRTMLHSPPHLDSAGIKLKDSVGTFHFLIVSERLSMQGAYYEKVCIVHLTVAWRICERIC